jgi:hypothetical protein
MEVRIVFWPVRGWFLVNAHRIRKRSREQVVISNCKPTDDLREGCDFFFCELYEIGYMTVVREN